MQSPSPCSVMTRDTPSLHRVAGRHPGLCAGARQSASGGRAPAIPLQASADAGIGLEGGLHGRRHAARQPDRRLAIVLLQQDVVLFRTVVIARSDHVGQLGPGLVARMPSPMMLVPFISQIAAEASSFCHRMSAARSPQPNHTDAPRHRCRRSRLHHGVDWRGEELRTWLLSRPVEEARSRSRSRKSGRHLSDLRVRGADGWG